MKAVTITDIEKVELREYPMPTVGENDVLIQIKACALCTMEQRIYLGKKDVGGYPVTAGHEASGVVVAVGERVKHCKVGDHVISRSLLWHMLLLPYRPCQPVRSGHCGRRVQTRRRRDEHGGYLAEYVSVNKIAWLLWMKRCPCPCGLDRTAGLLPGQRNQG
ncbi:MAG: alcohol dehydrogenase catalytic domain-containing protein [Christensenellales bacterium]